MACVVVGGCPWMVPSDEGASWGSWEGAMKNDTNFSGGYAYAVAAQYPHRGVSARKTGPGGGLCPIRALALSIPVQYGAGASGSKGSRVLSTCYDHRYASCGAHTTVRQCGLGGNTTVSTWG